jgi:hypothetical protein
VDAEFAVSIGIQRELAINEDGAGVCCPMDLCGIWSSGVQLSEYPFRLDLGVVRFAVHCDDIRPPALTHPPSCQVRQLAETLPQEELLHVTGR